MRKMVYKGGSEVWEDNDALFSSPDAFNQEYVIFVAKIRELIYLMEMGITNIVCIKNNPERLKGFLRFREGKMRQAIIYIKSLKAKDVLAPLATKPYYTITYVGDSSSDLKGQVQVKDAIGSRIENIRKDLENKELRRKLKEKEEEDDDYDDLEESP